MSDTRGAVLRAALRKLADRAAEFVELAAGTHPDQAIAHRLALTADQVAELRQHFAPRIRAWPREPHEVAQAGRNVLPPGDRD